MHAWERMMNSLPNTIIIFFVFIMYDAQMNLWCSYLKQRAGKQNMFSLNWILSVQIM